MRHNREREFWYDDENGPLVRPYAVTRGRTRPARPDLNLITLVVATTHESMAMMDPEYVEILHICQRPQSIAEISAKLGLPLSVIKILIADLIEQRFLIVSSPHSLINTDTPDMNLLQAVLDGLRRL